MALEGAEGSHRSHYPPAASLSTPGPEASVPSVPGGGWTLSQLAQWKGLVAVQGAPRWDTGPQALLASCALVTSLPREGLLVSTAQRLCGLAVQQDDTPLAPQNVWCSDAHGVAPRRRRQVAGWLLRAEDVEAALVGQLPLARVLVPTGSEGMRCAARCSLLLSLSPHPPSLEGFCTSLRGQLEAGLLPRHPDLSSICPSLLSACPCILVAPCCPLPACPPSLPTVTSL